MGHDILVAFDEAQVYLTSCVNQFSSGGASIPVMVESHLLFSILSEQWGKCQGMILLIAGTGLGLQELFSTFLVLPSIRTAPTYGDISSLTLAALREESK